jgi:hypothetical protein
MVGEVSNLVPVSVLYFIDLAFVLEAAGPIAVEQVGKILARRLAEVE